MLRDEHFHKSFLLRALRLWSSDFQQPEMVIHRRRLFASGPPWENAAVKPVQAETSAGPINTPTPGGCGWLGCGKFGKKKGIRKLSTGWQWSWVFCFFFWKLVCFFFGKPETPQKSLPRPQSCWAVSCRLDALQVFGLFHLLPPFGRNLAAGSIFMWTAVASFDLGWISEWTVVCRRNLQYGIQMNSLPQLSISEVLERLPE